MIGAIAGDFIGSVYEAGNMKRTDFPLFQPRCRFTDDTVLTVALADSILTGIPYVAKLKEYYRRYPRAGFSYDTLDEVLEQARRSAAVTHNHPEGVSGAQATAAAVFLARSGRGKDEI